MEIGKQIKKHRTALGLSQDEFADKIFVTRQSVSNWENDNVLPSIEMLVRLADYFNVSTDYLLGRSFDETISVKGLTEEQQTHIRFLVKDFFELNKKATDNRH